MKEHEVNQSRARSELAKALFIRDDVFKIIRNLSDYHIEYYEGDFDYYRYIKNRLENYKKA